MSRLKYQMGLARLRVRGQAAVQYRVLLRALGLNIHRVAAWKQALCLCQARWWVFWWLIRAINRPLAKRYLCKPMSAPDRKERAQRSFMTTIRAYN